MALGTGSAIAHHAVDSIMGPRKVEHVHNNAPAPEAPAAPAAPGELEEAERGKRRVLTGLTAGSSPMQCANEYSTFQECVKNSGGDVSACQFYMDMLTKCQRRELACAAQGLDVTCCMQSFLLLKCHRTSTAAASVLECFP